MPIDLSPDQPNLFPGEQVNPVLASYLSQQSFAANRQTDQQKQQQEKGIGWGTAISTEFKLSLVGQFGRAFVRSFSRGQDDPSFNAAQYILGHPGWKNDPSVKRLFMAGQFDDSHSLEQFINDYSEGMRYMHLMELHEREGWGQWALGQALLFTDETIATLGAGKIATATKLVKGLSFTGKGLGMMLADDPQYLNLAAKIAKLPRWGKYATHAGIGGGSNEGLHIAEGQVQPLADPKGMVDDFMAFGMGSIMAGGISAMMTGGSLGARSLAGGKIKRLQKRGLSMLMEKRFTLPEERKAWGAMANNGNYRPDGSLQDIWHRDNQTLKNALDADTIDNEVVTPLFRNGDENHQLLQELQAKYDAAGKQLNVTPSNFHRDYNTLMDGLDILNTVSKSKEAQGVDFDYGTLNRITSRVSKEYANIMGMSKVPAPAFVTPGERLVTAGLSYLQDVYRTLSGSAQTITAAEARSPLFNLAGASAEALKDKFGAANQTAIIGIRNLWFKEASKAAEKGPITYNGEVIPTRAFGWHLKGYGKFMKAVGNYGLHMEARHRYGTPVPEDVHPLIKQAYENTRPYFQSMAEEAEGVGLFHVGKRALADAQDIHTTINEKIDSLTGQINLFDEGALKDYHGGFSKKEIRSRLVGDADSVPTALDQAHAMLDNLGLADEDRGLSGFQPEYVTLHPDEKEQYTPQQLAKLAGHIRFSEDGAQEVAEHLSQQLIDQVINQALHGKKGILDNHINNLLDYPDGYDPQRVLDAWLIRLRDDATPEQIGKQVVINPSNLSEGARIRIYGRDLNVEHVDGEKFLVEDGGQGLTFNADSLDAIPVDVDSLPVDYSVQQVGAKPRQRTTGERLKRQLETMQTKRTANSDHIQKLEKAVEDIKHYFPHVFDVEAVRKDGEGFIHQLKESLWKAHSQKDGKPLEDNQRPLIGEVVEQMVKKGQLKASSLESIAETKANPLTGRITDDMAQATGAAAGEIRLEPGSIQHINENHGKQIRQAGFANTHEFVDYVLKNFNSIYKAESDTLLLAVKNGRPKVSFIELIPDKHKGYYRVNTAFPSRESYLKNKPLLWERAQTNQLFKEKPPSAVSGQSKGSDQIVNRLQGEGKPLDEIIAGLTEGDLLAGGRDKFSPELREIYQLHADEYFQRHAQAVHDKLVDPNYDGHGVSAGGGTDPTIERTLHVDPTDIIDYLDTNIEGVLEKYHHAMGGKIAVRRAIQLNPNIWKDKKLKDGSPIIDGASLKKFLREQNSALQRFADLADERAGRTSKDARSLAKLVHNANKRVENDILKPLDLLEGRKPYSSNRAADQTGRILLNLSFANKLGSVLWAQMNDLAPLTLGVIQHPRSLIAIGKAITAASSMSKHDLEVIGLLIERHTRSMSLGEVDTMITPRGKLRVPELLSEGAAKGVAKASLMDWWTNWSKRAAGELVMNRLVQQSKKLIRAGELVKGGMKEAEAIRRAGLSRFDAARLNHLGLNADRAMQFQHLIWQHGRMPDGSLIREKMPNFQDFLEYDKPVQINFADWPLKLQKNKELYDTLTANIANEVHRNMVVTPGVFDRPLANLQGPLGKMFNQFQTFSMAFVNQRLRPMAQMPAHYQTWYWMNYLALGALSDAIGNDLSGRRSFAETAKMWETHPMGMVYAAFTRSGLSGALGRPIVWLDQLGVPWSPGNLLGNTVTSTAAGHIIIRDKPTEAVDPASFALNAVVGPVGGDATRIASIAEDVFGAPPVTNWTAYNAWKLFPGQNLWQVRALHQLGLPTTPESLVNFDKNN